MRTGKIYNAIIKKDIPLTDHVLKWEKVKPVTLSEMKDAMKAMTIRFGGKVNG